MPFVEPRHEYPLSQDIVSVTAVFDTSEGRQEKEITYRLFDHPFNKKWAELIYQVEVESNQPRNGGDFYGSMFFNKEELARDFSEAMKVVSEYYPDYKFAAEPSPNLNREELNLLHDDFEVLKKRYVEDNLENIPLRDCIDCINLTVHRFENCNLEQDNSHVQILFDPTTRLPFTLEDYKLFSPNYHFGHMYLTYGLTGVPVESAFYARPVNPPRLQDVYTEGFVLHFGDDSIFNQWDKLEKWLQETYGWTSNDPKITVGLVPLGVLDGGFRSKEELQKVISATKEFKNIKLFGPTKNRLERGFDQPLFIKGMRPESNDQKALHENPPPKLNLHERENTPAKYPSGDFVESYLKLNSYLKIPMDFDAEACLQEGLALLNQFVAHRPEEQQKETTGGQWKSLALQAVGGDPYKTKYHTDYPEENPHYKLTPIAKQCPKTMDLVNKITDIDLCERVRFMLLEPGARIPLHSDAHDREVTMSMNVALNMPEGCEFWMNLNSDGSKHRFTKKLDVAQGDLIVANISKYHYLENNSETHRLHLIINGPLRITDSEIEALVALQSGTSEHKDFFAEQITQNIFSSSKNPEDTKFPLEVKKQWDSMGFSENSVPDFIKIFVVESELQDKELQNFCLKNVTCASLYPLRYEIIKEEVLAEKVLKSYSEGYSFAAIVRSGTLIDDLVGFAANLQRDCRRMELEQCVILGHIMDWKNKEPFVPYLHEQFAILNLQLWDSLGYVGFGELYGEEAMFFPEYKVSGENIHDDYTPTWICGSGKWRQNILIGGKSWWGANLLKQSVENNLKVLNVSHELRSTKSYAYPDANSWQVKEIKDKVSKRVNGELEKVFFFNNEPLTTATVSRLQPNTLIALASGIKVFKLIDQHWSESKEPEKIIVFDSSKKTLQYHMGLLNCENLEEMVSFIYEFSLNSESPLCSREFVRDQLISQLDAYFDGEAKKLFKSIKKFKNCKNTKYLKINIITEPEKLIEHISANDRFIFWHSNIWSSNSIFYSMNKEEIADNYKNLAASIGEKLGAETLVSKGNDESLIFKQRKNLMGVIDYLKGEQRRPVGYMCHARRDEPFLSPESF